MLILIVAGGIKLGQTGGGLIASFSCNPSIMRLTTYSLGCSLVAMINRIAGGNYTKAADISADIVAKIRHDMPEDDSRMPNTIADFIGDNVNDIAGNCSDLLESFVATVVACLLIAGTLASNGTNQALFNATSIYPIAIAGFGLVGSVVGIMYALHHKASDNPSQELDMATNISALIVIVASLFASRIILAASSSMILSCSAGFRRGLQVSSVSLAVLQSVKSPNTTPEQNLVPSRNWPQLPPKARLSW
jgi:K(+)-stimulated pyrophosphate-energized sodium pump